MGKTNRGDFIDERFFFFVDEGKAGNVHRAEELFRKVNSPDIVTFTAMSKSLVSPIGLFVTLSMCLVHSYGLNGLGQDAVQLFRRIPPEMISEKTYVCVLNACSHSGLVDEAREIFSKIPVKNKWNYTAMVKEFNTSKCSKRRFSLILGLGRLCQSVIRFR